MDAVKEFFFTKDLRSISVVSVVFQALRCCWAQQFHSFFREMDHTVDLLTAKISTLSFIGLFYFSAEWWPPSLTLTCLSSVYWDFPWTATKYKFNTRNQLWTFYLLYLSSSNEETGHKTASKSIVQLLLRVLKWRNCVKNIN